MALVLRDVVARLGIDYDDRGAKKADRSIGGLMKTLRGLGLAFGALQAGRGVLSLLTMASDVEENLNVMNHAFEDNASTVIQWSQEFGKAAGRSEFELQKVASTLGAVINPLMEGNAAAAADMSIGLSQLAVDLGSFFNAVDNDVLVALRSGLVGEMEPLRRFGVVMHQDALQAFALSQGIKGNIKDLSIAEKTQLRYNFIMENTTLAQGDAVRTAHLWANATKATKGALKDLGVTLGAILLPAMTSMLRIVRDSIRWFADLAKETNILQVSFVMLGTFAVAAAAKVIAAWSPVLLPFLKTALIIAALILVFEDLWTWLQGGDSVIGDLIDSLYGPGSAAEAAKAVREAFSELLTFYRDDFIPYLSIMRKELDDMFNDWIESAKKWFNWIGEKFDWFFELTEKADAWLFDNFGGALNALGFEEGPRMVAPSSIGGAGGGNNAISQGGVTINLNGPATPEAAKQIAGAAAGAVGTANKRTLAALTQRKRR